MRFSRRSLFPARSGLAGRFVLPAAAAYLLFAGGCAAGAHRTNPVRTAPYERRCIENVPFYAQTGRLCGPAALAAVFAYYGKAVSPDEIASHIYREALGGTLFLEMVLFARQQGFSADWYAGSPADIRQSVGRDRPLIVMIDQGIANIRKMHYWVLVGYDSEGVLVNSGSGRKTHLGWDAFLRQWERTDYWTLRVEPKTKGPRGESNL